MNPVDPSPISRADVPQLQTFIRATEAAPDRPVRVRIEFRLYDREKQRYYNWPGAEWTLDVAADSTVAQQLLDVFEEMSGLLTTLGPARVGELLREARPR